MTTFAFLLTQCVNALSQAALLFFLGVGLTLIFGIMRIVNFAHGTIYMLGAYIGYSAVRWIGSFWLGLVVAPVAVGLLGLGFELLLLRRLYGRDHSAFLMVTFGRWCSAMRCGCSGARRRSTSISPPVSAAWCSCSTSRSRPIACSYPAPVWSWRW
jgi:branched-subunit amino acid ABC-type transport system permease component